MPSRCSGHNKGRDSRTPTTSSLALRASVTPRGGATVPGRRGGPAFASIATGRVVVDGVPCRRQPTSASSTVTAQPMQCLAPIGLPQSRTIDITIPKTRDGESSRDLTPSGSPIPHYADSPDVETRTTASTWSIDPMGTLRRGGGFRSGQTDSSRRSGLIGARSCLARVGTRGTVGHFWDRFGDRISSMLRAMRSTTHNRVHPVIRETIGLASQSTEITIAKILGPFRIFSGVSSIHARKTTAAEAGRRRGCAMSRLLIAKLNALQLVELCEQTGAEGADRTKPSSRLLREVESSRSETDTSLLAQ